MSTAVEEVMIALRSQRNVIDTAIASLRVAFALEDTPSFVPATQIPPANEVEKVEVMAAEVVEFPEFPKGLNCRTDRNACPNTTEPTPKRKCTQRAEVACPPGPKPESELPKPTGPAPNAPAEDFDGLRRTSGIQDTATLRTMIVGALNRIGRPAAVSEITAACRLASDKKIYPSAVDRVLDGMLTEDIVKLADKANYSQGDVERWVLVDPDWTPTPRAGRSQAELRADVTRLCRRAPMTSGQIIAALSEYGKGSIYSCLTTMRKAGEIETQRTAEGDKNCWIGGEK